MGSSLSSGKDNDELINLLLSYNRITSKRVETAFRAVDRGDYISAPHREAAYRDMSCKVGNIHLSAPCVYSSVMEGLSLKPGLSFLNIGSGTGYLSTIAGLILGDGGTNHGIEMHEDCLIYAQEHLEEFKRKSLDVDVFEFCEPVFQLGNFLNVIPNRQYDRVYCGAACPEVHEKFVRQFVKIGGILVMPYKDQLLRSKRTGEETWRNHAMLPVSFATLMSPEEGVDRCLLQLPLWTPQSLQELCRSSIRRHIRKMVWAENKNLVVKRRLTLSSKTDDQALSGWQSEVVIPMTRDRLLLQREGIAPLQLAMNSTTQTILEECLRFFVSPDTVNDSDDSEDSESEMEDVFAPNCRMNPFAIREQLNADSWQIEHYGFDEEEEEEEEEDVEHDDDDDDENTMDFEMGNYVNNKETQDVAMKDETESDDNNKKNENEGEEVEEEKLAENEKQSGSTNDQSSSSRKKRNASEKSNDSPDDSESTPHGLMSNDKIKSSLYKRPLLRMKMTESKIVNSDSSDSSCEDDEITRRIKHAFETDLKAIDNDQAVNNESVSSEYDFENGESSQPSPPISPTGQSPFSWMKHFKDQSTKIQNLAERSRCNGDNNRRVNETGKIEDKNDRIINLDSSDPSSSEDEYEKAANNRRDYRACLKRRSERKSLSSGSDGSSNFGKKSNISEPNNSSENSPSTINSVTSSSEGKSSTSGSNGSSNFGKKSNISESNDSSVNSTSTGNSGTPNSDKKSSPSGYSLSTRTDSSNENSRSDSDDDTFFSVRESNDEKTYSHIIKKDLFSNCMKKKVLQLPLPPPLRLYINYNRELV